MQVKMKEKSKYKIYIDTTDRYLKKVSLAQIGPGDKEEVLETKEGDIDVINSIKSLLEKYNLFVSDIERFVPNLGPGSFTGLKMGVTDANILNWLNGKSSIEKLDYPNYGREPNISKPKKAWKDEI